MDPAGGPPGGLSGWPSAEPDAHVIGVTPDRSGRWPSAQVNGPAGADLTRRRACATPGGSGSRDPTRSALGDQIQWRAAPVDDQWPVSARLPASTAGRVVRMVIRPP